jgi:hypothetical protein
MSFSPRRSRPALEQSCDGNKCAKRRCLPNAGCIAILIACSSSLKLMPPLSAISSRRKASCQRRSNCVGGSGGSPTMPRRGNALGPSLGGSHCRLRHPQSHGFAPARVNPSEPMGRDHGIRVDFLSAHSGPGRPGSSGFVRRPGSAGLWSARCARHTRSGSAIVKPMPAPLSSTQPDCEMPSHCGRAVRFCHREWKDVRYCRGLHKRDAALAGQQSRPRSRFTVTRRGATAPVPLMPWHSPR